MIDRHPEIAESIDDSSDTVDTAPAIPATGAPVGKIHNAPFRIARVSRGGRPRPSARRRGKRNSGSNTVHSSSFIAPRLGMATWKSA
jgi:hypothetical protein